MDTMNVDLRCRLCASIFGLGICIFGAQGVKMEVKQKISTYLALEVESGDALPKNICYLCLGRLEEFDKYKTMCSETQLTLKNWATDSLVDEDMSFCADSKCDDREENEYCCTSFLGADICTTSSHDVNRQHVEQSSKVQSIRYDRTEQNPSETLATEGPSETCINANDLSGPAFFRYNSPSYRRKIGNHGKNTTEQLVQDEESSDTDDTGDEDQGEDEDQDQDEDQDEDEEDLEEEGGFPGFVATRHASAGYKLLMDTYEPSSENESMGEVSRDGGQNEYNNPDCSQDNIGIMQFTQTGNETELSSVVKQEPGEEAYPQWQCTVCHRIFTRHSNLVEHHKLHTENDPCICPSCGKPFGNNYGLMLHMSTHKNEGYKCHECSMEFSQEKTFHEHLQIHHSVRQCPPKTSTPKIQYVPKTSVKQAEKRKKLRTYCCKYCSAKFQDKRNCVDHMRCHFGEKPYSCNLCDLKFTQHRNLLAHRKVHRNESATCTLCMVQFSSTAELTKHLSVTHRKDVLEIFNDANHGSNE